MSCMSGSPNLNSFRDRGQVAVQLVSCGVLLPGLQQQKKRICEIVDFAVPADHRIDLKESEKKDKYLDLTRELKTVEHESNDCTSCDWCVRHKDKWVIKRLGGLGIWRTGRDYPNDSIAEDGQNTETSPGDLRRLSWMLEKSNSFILTFFGS